MSSPFVTVSDGENVKFVRVSLQPGTKKSTQLAYFNHEGDVDHAVQAIFQDRSFDLLPPKLIIALEGGLNTSSERAIDFNEKQLSTSIAKLLLDIGRNKLSVHNGTPWLFSSARHDSVAGRIIQITKRQYLANDIPLSRFVNIGIDVCASVPLNRTPHDYRSIAHGVLSANMDVISDASIQSHRILNQRLSRLILYGKQKQDSIDRYTILQRCIDQIREKRENDAHESVSVPKLILLYGGDYHHIEPIHRLMKADDYQKEFGLVILRGSGGLADVLAWVCDKIRDSSSLSLKDSRRQSLTESFVRELKVLVQQLLGSDPHDELTRLAEYLWLTRCERVRVCDEDDDFSLYFLETLVAENQTQRIPSLKLHLSLAFDLNQAKFASKILRANQDLPEEDLIQLAKMAIIRDQVEFLQVLEDACGVTSDSLGENFHLELSNKMGYNHALFLECIRQDFGCDLDDIYRPIDQTSDHGEDEIHSINVKLFLWAIFFDHYNLSLHFWKRLNDRLCGALAAALVYRHTADLCVKRSSTESITVQTLRDHADEYEKLAVRLLHSLYTSSSNMARLAIERENSEFNKASSLEIAIRSKSENLIGHTCVQEVFDIVWSGDSHRKTKDKSFNRMLASTTSSFGQATNAIAAEDYRSLFKYFLTMKNRLSHPRIKYYVHFVFYLIFLCLLSYLVLFVKTPLLVINEELEHSADNETCVQRVVPCSDPPSFVQPWSILQMVINIYIFMFAVEKFRQAKALRTEDMGMRRATINHLSESWNLLDAFCICFYMISVGLECFNTKFVLNASRAFLAVDVVLWFIRLLVLLMIDRTVGPMLLMIQAMVKDMATFFSIFSVFTSAYGVASFALLRSGQLTLDLSIIRKIFHQAYWHVFGQINDLDDIENNFELTGWAAFVLLALYMAVSNILLVNLLVATFSHTFDRMFSKMDTLWKFHRYHVLKEYTVLSALPPPLNLFSKSTQNLRPFHPELSPEQIITLQRREALAYASDVFEHARKDDQPDAIRRERLDSHLRQLRKIIAHVKVTCEASTQDLDR